MKTTMRILTTFLALFLALTPVTVFAASDTLTEKDKNHNIDVRAKYVDGAVTPDVYSMDVVWGAMQFTYETSGTREWDPSSHEYTGTIAGAWAATGNTVTVTNHSNKAVTVVFAYAKSTGFDGINGKFSVTSETLSAGVEGDVDGADSVSTTLTLSGTLASNVTEFRKIGFITIALQ